MFSPYQSAFEKARERILGFRKTDVACKTGLWPDDVAPKCLVLKLLKPHWSNDPPETVGNDCGIFFSAWIDIESLRPNRRLHYNIHALKLRDLPGYKLESRKFAEAFRVAFIAMKGPWPNLSLDHGPQTLIEGFIEVVSSSCESELVGLGMRFFPVIALIDDLLAQAKS